jgi:plasmid stability protein
MKNARQYTIRNVPASVDRALRRKAKELGQSFNRVALEALSAGVGEPLVRKRDLSGIAGSLSAKDAVGLEQEIRRQRRIDSKLWK